MIMMISFILKVVALKSLKNKILVYFSSDFGVDLILIWAKQRSFPEFPGDIKRSKDWLQ